MGYLLDALEKTASEDKRRWRDIKERRDILKWMDKAYDYVDKKQGGKVPRSYIGEQRQENRKDFERGEPKNIAAYGIKQLKRHVTKSRQERRDEDKKALNLDAQIRVTDRNFPTYDIGFYEDLNDFVK